MVCSPHCYSVVVRPGRASAVYDLGETVLFRAEMVPAAPHAPTTLLYVLTWDGAEVIERGTLSFSHEVASISYRPNRPGFVRLSIEGEQTSVLERLCHAAAAVAVAPADIRPALPAPTDFDAFWKEKLAPQRDAPLNSELRFHEERPEAAVYAVTAVMPDGDTLHGWLLRPKGRGPFPGLALYHGAGVYPVGVDHGLDWAARGVMVLSLNPHAVPNNRPREYYVEMGRGPLSNYRTMGRENRDRLYFVQMFLRAARAVDLLTDLPDWDRTHVLAVGHSQGGAQALAAAALNPKVTGLIATCCTHCDHAGPLAGRPAGWPKIVEVHDGVLNPIHVEAARYIDAVNFAARVSCPSLIGICFLDDLCPPTGVYAAFNALRGPKMIHLEPTAGHEHTFGAREAAYAWAGAQIR